MILAFIGELTSPLFNISLISSTLARTMAGSCARKARAIFDRVFPGFTILLLIYRTTIGPLVALHLAQ